MFRTACTIAREFTRPLFLCRQTVSGQCSNSIGSFVVVNDAGWIVTAKHMTDHLQKLISEEANTKALQTAGTKVDDDATLHAGARLGEFPSNLVDVAIHPTVDLAIGRLDPFDPTWVTSYPVFKDPTKDFAPGASLCKYGYPFATATAIWDQVSGRFQVQAHPLPIFPIEGIFTRSVEVRNPNVTKPYPAMYVETSSPGLRGQSGGPTFDVHGAVWAIQSQTHHFALGFNPAVPNATNGETEHQFLNVGWGVHSVTVIGMLNELNIAHSVSPF